MRAEPTTPTPIVVDSKAYQVNARSSAASRAARTTGKYSGRQPAITALTAAFSTVQQNLRSLTLAIRLNETRIAGNIQGQQALTIRYGGQTTTLQFTLFVAKQE